MIKANNLSDLTNKTEARKNLDVYGKSEVDAKIQNATPNIDLSGYAKKQHAHTIADVTNLQLSLDGKAPKVHTHTIDQITDLQAKLDAKIDKSEKGQPNGVATLNANGAIDSKHIPPYLENPLVYQNRTKFPPTGRIGKLYMDEETGNLYVWNQNQYKEYTEHIGRTKSLANGTDLNDILEDGWFVSETNMKSSTLRNVPVQKAFTLMSYKAAGFIQELITFDVTSRWIRRYYSFKKEWSAWQEVPITKDDFSVIRDVQYFDPQSNKANSFFSARSIGHIHMFNDQSDNIKSIIMGFNSKNIFDFYSLDEENSNTMLFTIYPNLTSNINLNDLDRPGRYYCKLTASAKTHLNTPVPQDKMVAYSLVVYRASGVIQVLT